MSKLDLRVRFNNKLHSIILNDYRIGGCKWNDIENGKCIEYPVNKEDIVIALGIDKTIADLQSQLDQQKAMWKMLKYFIINRPYCAGYVILESGMRVITDILATMRKLEKGEDDE